MDINWCLTCSKRLVGDHSDTDSYLSSYCSQQCFDADKARPQGSEPTMIPHLLRSSNGPFPAMANGSATSHSSVRSRRGSGARTEASTPSTAAHVSLRSPRINYGEGIHKWARSVPALTASSGGLSSPFSSSSGRLSFHRRPGLASPSTPSNFILPVHPGVKPSTKLAFHRGKSDNTSKVVHGIPTTPSNSPSPIESDVASQFTYPALTINNSLSDLASLLTPISAIIIPTPIDDDLAGEEEWGGRGRERAYSGTKERFRRSETVRGRRGARPVKIFSPLDGDRELSRGRRIGGGRLVYGSDDDDEAPELNEQRGRGHARREGRSGR